MPFPDPCAQCTAITRGGKVVYYICRNKESTHFNKGVSLATHNACQRRGQDGQDTPAQTEPAPPPEIPSFARRVLTYAEALVQWKAAGMPERSDAEVDCIFHRFCKPCGWFDPDKLACRGCGCRVADYGFAVFNKIKMATEHCPQDLW
jgi:hypothetical protein